MTPTISPVSGALPQQPAPTPLATTSASTSTPVNASIASSQAAIGTAPATSAPAATTGSAALQATQGAAAVSPEQLVPLLQELVRALSALATVLQQQGAITGGGGAPGQSPVQAPVQEPAPSGCGCSHGGTPAQGDPGQKVGGAMGGYTPSDADKQQPKDAKRAKAPKVDPSSVQRVDPSNTKDKTSTSGLTSASKRGLEEAHSFGLPLVSGKRSGGGSSDHDHGNAIDVGTLPIGVPSSDGATPHMQAFAEHMRAQGKAGKLNVKYIITDGKIASATNDWEWREYTYPGKSASSIAALKASNRGEYNRLQHYDHVHVSFS